MRLFKCGFILSAIAGLSALPAFAADQKSNFGTLTLSAESKPTDEFKGYTGGSFQLPSIANRDRQGKLCLGFADQNPDYILVLQKDFPQLKIQVDSGGKDTTLLIKEPDGSIRCGDDTGTSKDASVEDTNWKAGTYRIWVGSSEAGVKWNYKLSIQQ
jgi:hypothetical protein